MSAMKPRKPPSTCRVLFAIFFLNAILSGRVHDDIPNAIFLLGIMWWGHLIVHGEEPARRTTKDWLFLDLIVVIAPIVRGVAAIILGGLLGNALDHVLIQAGVPDAAAIVVGTAFVLLMVWPFVGRHRTTKPTDSRLAGTYAAP